MAKSGTKLSPVDLRSDVETSNGEEFCEIQSRGPEVRCTLW